MIKLAYNKEKPWLVFEIDKVIREQFVGGIVEYYLGSLTDTSTDPDTTVDNYKVQVAAFESNWAVVPVDLGSTGDINNQSKTVDAATTDVTVKPDTGYTGLSKVKVNAVTSSIDPNIAAGNIKDGVTILGVTGSYVKPDEPNLVAGNIKKGATIYGITGTFESFDVAFKTFDLSGVIGLKLCGAEINPDYWQVKTGYEGVWEPKDPSTISIVLDEDVTASNWGYDTINDHFIFDATEVTALVTKYGPYLTGCPIVATANAGLFKNGTKLSNSVNMSEVFQTAHEPIWLVDPVNNTNN